jgi:predicted site-specific integrase-resolvase
MASKILGLHPNTLRKYADEEKIQYIKNPAGQRLYDVGSFIGSKTPIKTVCYCRVSSTKQKDDLQRQIKYLKEHYQDCEIITDIGSGINYKRKGLQTILGRIMQGERLKIVVAYRDRLVRFGFEIIEFLVKQNGGEILVLNQINLSPTEELSTDLLSIITVFSCRINGLRKYHKQIKEDKDLSN